MHKFVLNFGYWPVIKSVNFQGGKIEPVDGLAELISEINEKTYAKNGLMYPPIQSIAKSRDDVEWTTVPHSEHSAEIYHWDSTHTLHVNLPSDLALNNFQENPTFYLLQALAFIEGVRCMPDEWWFFGKLPLKNLSHAHFLSITDALNASIDTWNKMSPHSRVQLTNILQFYNSIVGFKWFWERFSHEYSTLDACWRFMFPDDKVRGQKIKKHSGRILSLLDELGIMFEKSHINDIVSTRNNMIHELSWGGETFVGDSNLDKARYASDLRRMNNRIIGTMLGMSGPYFRSSFTGIGTILVDQVRE